jgi:hypothetical protein
MCIDQTAQKFRDGRESVQVRWGAGQGVQVTSDEYAGGAARRTAPPSGGPYLFANAGRGRLESHTCLAIMPGTVASAGPPRPTGAPM